MFGCLVVLGGQLGRVHSQNLIHLGIRSFGDYRIS
jgi:hypothetical protein